MKRSVLIMTYCALTFSSLILEMILTGNILKKLSYFPINTHQTLTFKYQLVYTKVLLLLDTFYYTAFYLEKKINSIIQLRIVKIINITVWFIIAYNIGFSYDFICCFVIQALSLIVIGYSADTEIGYIYTQYNHRISTDVNIINMNIVLEVILGLKSAIALFLFVLIFADFASGRWSYYRILSYLKMMAFLIDRALQRRNLSVYVFNITSVVMFGILNIYGLYYTYTLFRDSIVLENEISVFLELLSFIMILLIVYYLYLYRNRKVIYRN